MLMTSDWKWNFRIKFYVEFKFVKTENKLAFKAL